MKSGFGPSSLTVFTDMLLYSLEKQVNIKVKFADDSVFSV